MLAELTAPVNDQLITDLLLERLYRLTLLLFKLEQLAWLLLALVELGYLDEHLLE